MCNATIKKNVETMNTLTYGVEIEYTGASRSRVRDAIATVLGSTDTWNEVSYQARCVRDSQGRTWKVVSDASVTGSGWDEGGELVTPVLKGMTGEGDDMATLQECIRAMRRVGARVDSSCGIHIHVGGKFFDAPAIQRLFKLYYANEELIKRMVAPNANRRSERFEPTEGWARPMDAGRSGEAADKIMNLRRPSHDTICAAYYSGYFQGIRNESDAARGTSTHSPRGLNHYHDARYRAINLHSFYFENRRTVEFRIFDASLHAGQVKSYVQFVLALSARAINAKRMRKARKEETEVTREAARLFCLHTGMQGATFATARLFMVQRAFDALTEERTYRF